MTTTPRSSPAGEVIGAIERRAAPGEWRTNIALGGTRSPHVPDPEVVALAQATALASELDLVGVDLLPRDGGWDVLELNGAVDFTWDYAPAGDAFAATLTALARGAATRGTATAPRVAALMSST